MDSKSQDLDSTDLMEAVAAALIEDPQSFQHVSTSTAFRLTRDQRERIALAGLRRRFAELRPKIGVLDRMATDQGLNDVETVEAGSYLLFPHTVYKSYPMSVLERGQFDRLTRWLQGLTALDLGGLDLTGVDSIDGWITTLNQQAGVQVVHTSGTTGKLSFLPRARADQDIRLLMQANNVRDWNGDGTGPDILGKPYPVLYPSYRSGASTPHRSVEALIKLVARDEDNVLTLYPGYFSADLASLAGRLRVADTRGEQGKVEITPSLMARRDEAIAMEQNREALLDQFFSAAEARFRGRDVVILSVISMAFEWAEAGLARGIRGLFGKGSVLITGGGSKGRALPADAREQVAEFLGFDTFVESYGMSEMTGFFRKCEHNHYHIPPYIVPYVLDGETGELLPREGVQTGRLGFVDLFPADHWGGFLTGDKVTMAGWTDTCACHRTGPYVEVNVERFSDLQGDDDKITCAGAPAAHDRAMEYLARLGE